MEDLVTITVNGQQLQAPKGTLLWEACRAHGIDIPIFCYHTKLGPVGACRTCLVEQEGVTKGPITACSTPITDGMVIRTQSAVVEKAQRGIFEFLLANHPLDCPICDRAGECPLQDQTFRWGPGTSRYIEPKRHHVKPIVLGPTIALDRERCVLCWRCVRFCAEVAEDKSIVLLDRGDHSMVGTFQDQPYVSNFSGNVVELCPVGALTSRKQRFNFRPWELQNRPSVCPHCPMGCNINVSVRKNDEVIRFLSRDNPDVDNSWLCDRGRFNFEFINSPHRLKSPLIRREEGFVETSWDEALRYIAERLTAILEDENAGPKSVAGLAAPHLTNEDLFVFQRFMRDVIGSNNLDHAPRSSMLLTSAQVQTLRGLEENIATISDLVAAKTIVLLDANPSKRTPVLELRIREAVNRHGATLVSVQSDEIPLSARAQHRIDIAPGGLVAWVTGVLPSLDASAAASPLRDALLSAATVIAYDDTFESSADRGAALAAVASLTGAIPGAKVLPLLQESNSRGARDLGVFPDGNPWSSLPGTGLLDEQVRAALVFGADPVAELGQTAADRLASLELLVVTDILPNETARQADVILPAASFAEKTGTLTNIERRVQLLAPAIPAPGMARSEWDILVDLSQYFPQALEYVSAAQIWDDIGRGTSPLAGLRYEDIGPRGTRPRALQPV